MNSNKLHSPWYWIPCLFAAEEIPSAVVTYVALLMFLQFGTSTTLATLYGALLAMGAEVVLLQQGAEGWTVQTLSTSCGDADARLSYRTRCVYL